MVEHLTFNQGVPGSIPGGPTSLRSRGSFASFGWARQDQQINSVSVIRMVQRSIGSESHRVGSNACVSKAFPALGSCLIFLVCAVTVAAQRGTDFSGSWVLDETQVRPAPDIPQRLVVEQPLTTTNLRGEPMPPAYLTLEVKRYVGDVVQHDLYRIGLIGGTVAGLPDRGGPPGPACGGSRYEVTWRFDFLWIYRETCSAPGAITRRGETWRIDDRGRLVISIETREQDEAATTQTLAYRRDKQ